MTQFIRNMALACLGLMIMVGMMTAGVFIGLLAIAVGALWWGYVMLRKAGIINPPKSQSPMQDPRIIEVDYVVVEEVKQRDTPH
jgi:hypothetical protein